MQIILLKDPDDKQLLEVKRIYEEAFPIHERRIFDMLPKMLNNVPGMELAIFNDAKLMVGFVVYWQWENWAYIEHLAVDRRLRANGYGNRVMTLLTAMLKGTIVLEVEKPYDEVARKRITFYKKLGFHLAPFDYHQPSYVKGGEEIPMHLMTYPGEVDELSFLEFARQIRQQVYEYFY